MSHVRQYVLKNLMCSYSLLFVFFLYLFHSYSYEEINFAPQLV